MADAKTVDTAAPKKARKAQGPRQAKPLNLLLVNDDSGKPTVAVGSYNSQDILSEFVRLTGEGRNPVLATWTPPAKSK